MRWCWLIGHHFRITQIGNTCYKSCRCGETYVLVERVSRLGNGVKDEYWKKMDDVKRNRKL